MRNWNKGLRSWRGALQGKRAEEELKKVVTELHSL